LGLITLTKISSKPEFENCKIERTVFGDKSQYNEHYEDKSQHIYNDNSRHIYSGNHSTYKGQKETDNIFMSIYFALIEKLAPKFFSRFGETGTMLLGFLSLILGGITLNSSVIYNLSNNFWIISNDVGHHLETLTIFFGFLLFTVGIIMVSSKMISTQTKCEQCKRNFGYKETKRPLVEETKCSDGIRKTTTRYYKCQFCGYETEIPFERLIKYEELKK
jgi:hypothetical protein